MSEEQENYQQYMMSNQNQLANSSFVQIRLDTKPLLNDIEVFLSAKRAVMETSEDGEFIERYEELGLPLANPEGITAILNIIRMSMMNEHIVQGNLMRDEYIMLLVNARKELTDHIITNCYEWGIADSKLNMVIDTIMRFFKLFISRVINNEERKSYMQQFVSRESFTQGKKEPILKNFAQGLGR
mgnify:CR=1 FL=1|jgi:hypothetical protein|tara:strand:- start:2013 stop:2567 length:555 start_codon:yes stop_codon:yes gene_type:complete